MDSFKEINALGIEEILRRIKDTQREQLKCRMEIKSGSRKDSHTLKKLQKTAARLKTRKRQLSQNK